MTTDSAETLALINGLIYPFASPGKSSALFMKDGLVGKLGTDREILACCSARTTVLDLKGGVVLPGFVDASAEVFRNEGSGRLDLPLLSRMANAGITMVQANLPVFEEKEDGWKNKVSRESPVRLLPRCTARCYEDVKKVVKSCEERRTNDQRLLVVLDGSLVDRTAALTADYSDDSGNRGVLLVEREELFAMLDLACGSGWIVVLQAAGDAAIDLAIEAFDHAKAAGHPCSRCGIGGCVAARPGQFTKLSGFGIGAEIRPHLLGEQWRLVLPRLGSERARTTFAWHTMLKRGIELAAASAYPEGPLEPLTGIAALASRRDAGGQPLAGWMPSEAIDRVEALWIYTGGAAAALGMSHLRGTLEPGKLADLVVLMQNPFTVSPDEIAQIEIGMTVVGGKIRKIL